MLIAPASLRTMRLSPQALDMRPLVERFYNFVESDPVLRPLYPPNLEPGKAHLAAFLTQYWGGPPSYSLERDIRACGCGTLISLLAKPSGTLGCST